MKREEKLAYIEGLKESVHIFDENSSNFRCIIQQKIDALHQNLKEDQCVLNGYNKALYYLKEYVSNTSFINEQQYLDLLLFLEGKKECLVG